MKLSVQEILAANQGLPEMLTWSLPAATSLKVARMAKAIRAEAQTIMGVRNDLIRKYGSPDDKGNHVINQEHENWPAFNEELQALLAEEVEIDVEPVELPASLEISAGAILALEKLVTIAE